jgi:hypothetical protein
VTQLRCLGSASNAATVGSALARPNANFRKSRCRLVAVFLVACVETLPPEQAAPWQAAHMQTMKSIAMQYVGNHRCGGVKTLH